MQNVLSEDFKFKISKIKKNIQPSEEYSGMELLEY